MSTGKRLVFERRGGPPHTIDGGQAGDAAVEVTPRSEPGARGFGCLTHELSNGPRAARVGSASVAEDDQWPFEAEGTRILAG